VSNGNFRETGLSRSGTGGDACIDSREYSCPAVHVYAITWAYVISSVRSLALLFGAKMGVPLTREM